METARLFSEPYDIITRLETPQNTPTTVKYHVYTRKRKMAEPRKRLRPSRIHHRIETPLILHGDTMVCMFSE